VAAFSFSPSVPTAGQTVTFTDASTNTPVSWSWKFGDGSTSTSRNPTHAYSKAGRYTVTLTARNTRGSGTSIKTIIVR
jgi:PKD repeat protein